MAKLDRAQQLLHLRTLHPWPRTRPDLPFIDQGWLVDSTRELLGETIVTTQPQIVLELGAWLGKSTRFILGQKPDVHVLSVDIWDPAKLRGWIAAKHPHLKDVVEHCREQFLANCWEQRERVTPMQCTSLTALQKLAALPLPPDLIYLDTSHSYQDTRDELAAISKTFPRATLVGDDWQWRASPGKDGPVAHAVRDHYGKRSDRVHVHGNGWRVRP